MESDKPIYKILEVLGGVIFGFAAWWLSAKFDLKDIASGLTIGLVVALCVDVARNHYLEGNNAKAMDAKIGALAAELAHPYGTSFLAVKAIALSRQKIPPEEMESVWTELSSLMQKKYRATNSIKPTLIYGPKHADAVMTVQKAKVVAQSASIAKVFIVDSESELGEEPMLKIIRHHREANIGIKYITIKELSRFENLGKKEKKLLSVDFAIFDDEVVLIWYVNKTTRDYTGGEVLYGPGECKKYDDYYEALQHEASGDFKKFLS